MILIRVSAAIPFLVSAHMAYPQGSQWDEGAPPSGFGADVEDAGIDLVGKSYKAGRRAGEESSEFWAGHIASLNETQYYIGSWFYTFAIGVAICVALIFVISIGIIKGSWTVDFTTGTRFATGDGGDYVAYQVSPGIATRFDSYWFWVAFVIGAAAPLILTVAFSFLMHWRHRHEYFSEYNHLSSLMIEYNAKVLVEDYDLLTHVACAPTLILMGMALAWLIGMIEWVEIFAFCIIITGERIACWSFEAINIRRFNRKIPLAAAVHKLSYDDSVYYRSIQMIPGILMYFLWMGNVVMGWTYFWKFPAAQRPAWLYGLFFVYYFVDTVFNLSSTVHYSLSDTAVARFFKALLRFPYAPVAFAIGLAQGSRIARGKVDKNTVRSWHRPLENIFTKSATDILLTYLGALIFYWVVYSEIGTLDVWPLQH